VGDPVQIDLVALFDGFSGGPGFGQTERGQGAVKREFSFDEPVLDPAMHPETSGEHQVGGV
jgi:hypothetical protein